MPLRESTRSRASQGPSAVSVYADIPCQIQTFPHPRGAGSYDFRAETARGQGAEKNPGVLLLCATP